MPNTYLLLINENDIKRNKLLYFLHLDIERREKWFSPFKMKNDIHLVVPKD